MDPKMEEFKSTSPLPESEEDPVLDLSINKRRYSRSSTHLSPHTERPSNHQYKPPYYVPNTPHQMSRLISSVEAVSTTPDRETSIDEIRRHVSSMDSSQISNIKNSMSDSETILSFSSETVATDEFGIMSTLAVSPDLSFPYIDLNIQAEEFAKYKREVCGTLEDTNPKTNANMRRTQMDPTKRKDPEYLEKRRKNNEAAKRSRDARRQKDRELQLLCGFLKQKLIEKNQQLAFANAELKKTKEDLLRFRSVIAHIMPVNSVPQTRRMGSI